ncbi:MAG: 30S ribosome-binding factor RbfA [Candidatus Hydrothermales bacterium]
MKTYRPERISKEIMKVINEVIREDINDPRIANLIILEVEVSNDLKKAKIHYTQLKEEKEENIEKVLERARSYIRKKIAEKIELKFMPEIFFIRR